MMVMYAHDSLVFLVMAPVILQAVTAAARRQYVLNRPEQPRMLPIGYPISPFHFPWTCVLVHTSSNEHDPGKQIPVSMCSIFTSRYILTSLNNLHKLVDDGSSRANYFWGRLDVLSAWANLKKVVLGRENRGAQEKKIEALWVPLTSWAYTEISRRSTENQYFYMNPKHPVNITDLVELDVSGFAANIVLMKVKRIPGSNDDSWAWNEWVLPIPMFLHVRPIDRAKRPFQGFVHHWEEMQERLEVEPELLGPCSIGSFGLGSKIQARRVSRFMMQQVIYVPRRACMEAFCQYDLSYCNEFPREYFHVCFKSITFPDLCQIDEGAALHCNWFNDSVFAILSKAVNCGLDGLPSVYTLVGPLVYMYKAIFQLERYEQIPNNEMKKERYLYSLPDAPPTPVDEAEHLPAPWG